MLLYATMTGGASTEFMSNDRKLDSLVGPTSSELYRRWVQTRQYSLVLTDTEIARLFVRSPTTIRMVAHQTNGRWHVPARKDTLDDGEFEVAWNCISCEDVL